MAAPGLSTLQHVTDRKLNKLATQRASFEADKKAIFAKVAEASDQRAKVQALLDGIEHCRMVQKQPGLHIDNISTFLHQSKHDPSVSSAQLLEWQTQLENEFTITSNKYEYADLFGKLVVEWIKHPNPATSTSSSALIGSDTDTEMSDSFDHVGRKEMHEQRKEWESCAFVEKKVDQEKIDAYLNEIFTSTSSKKIKKSPLQNLRDAMKSVMDFKSELETPTSKEDKKTATPANRLTVEKLKSCIKGVLQTDLLVGQKREALIDLESQPAILKELVDVLNMDLEALDTWEWEPAPVPLNMRRQLNGRYRVYMDEETHQALLLHWVGQVWAAALKTAFLEFYHSGAWLETPYRPMGRKARERREKYVGDISRKEQADRVQREFAESRGRGGRGLWRSRVGRKTGTVRNQRRTDYMDDYFMTQLPNEQNEKVRAYAGSDDEDDDGENRSRKSPMVIKQNMLRLVTTEMLLNTKVYNEFTVFQSDFKWFGPSLSHDTIFAVLNFFGVPGKWLRFFKKFLGAEVIWAHDGPTAEPHVRKCGIPMSHVLSDALGEAVLFCLDFAVNKRTQGTNIYRFHDDLWFWGQETTCITAWNAIQEFSMVMGLELNQNKTGAALVVADKDKARPLAASLPQGKIKWGFLVLDAEASRWVIDRAQVDEHIVELRRQLGACQSIIAWVQAWNSYVCRFFSTNLGKPANCLGRQHNDMVIETFEHIQRGLFAEAGTANVTEYLRGVLKERFGTDDTVPDAFFYFATQMGGLGLRNPSITLFATHQKSFRDSGERIDRAFEEEQEEYERLKDMWIDVHNPTGKSLGKRKRSESTETGSDSFMSFEEYTKYREEVSDPLHKAYTNLMEAPPEKMMTTSSGFACSLSEEMFESPYWLWIFSLYAGDMKQRFGGGGLQLVEPELLPLGLIEVLKGPVRWEN